MNYTHFVQLDQQIDHFGPTTKQKKAYKIRFY